ncbi:MAG: twin-arginine translocase TatA/TatE family subunit [Candidatus Riflebacteria bacterium]|nr:twin-arginine translocase TatA/TatE family subunit [Candidatus Riflebacteria bacterium]
MGIGFTELIVILVIVLILFGPGKLPEIGKALGRGIREFKKAQRDLMDDDDEPHQTLPKPPVRNEITASGPSAESTKTPESKSENPSDHHPGERIS